MWSVQLRLCQYDLLELNCGEGERVEYDRV